MKFISGKMSIETVIKKKEKNPRTHTHNSVSVNKAHCSYRHKTYIYTGNTGAKNFRKTTEMHGYSIS